MEAADRQVLRRCRVRLVSELQVASLWDLLLSRELFTPDMIEDIQKAGSGSRRDQARQLVTDLETRGRQALPSFISCLEDTGQDSLASYLRTSRQSSLQNPRAVSPLDHLPRVLEPIDLRPQVSRPVDSGSGPVSNSGVVESWKEKADLAYILKADPCGHCLIINNVNFCPESRLRTRVGSDIDCGKLQRRFGSMHFLVEVLCDLTAQQMGQALVQLARRDHSALDCCVVAILSHGCQELPRSSEELATPPGYGSVPEGSLLGDSWKRQAVLTGLPPSDFLQSWHRNSQLLPWTCRVLLHDPDC